MLGISAIALGAFASAAKPDKPAGKTENAPGSITLNIADGGPGLIGDYTLPSSTYNPTFTDARAPGSLDCVRLVVPSRDGVDQGRVTMFHRGPFEDCAPFQLENPRSFGVAYDSNDDGFVDVTESGLQGQFRCWAIFADDNSGAYCRFLIMNDVGDVLGSIQWAEVTVSGFGDVRTVVNLNNKNAELYEVVEVSQGNGGKTKTELQSQGVESIPLDFTVTRLSY